MSVPYLHITDGSPDLLVEAYILAMRYERIVQMHELSITDALRVWAQVQREFTTNQSTISVVKE